MNEPLRGQARAKMRAPSARRHGPAAAQGKGAQPGAQRRGCPTQIHKSPGPIHSQLILLCPGSPGNTRSRGPRPSGSGLPGSQGPPYPVSALPWSALCSPKPAENRILCGLAPPRGRLWVCGGRAWRLESRRLCRPLASASGEEHEGLSNFHTRTLINAGLILTTPVINL